MIGYESIPQIKHIMSFYITQSIITDIINTFLFLSTFTILRWLSIIASC